MKKLIGILAALTICASAFSLDLAVVGGPSINSLNGSISNNGTSYNISPDKVIWGGRIGAALEIPLGKLLAIQPEAIFHFNNGGEYTWSYTLLSQTVSNSRQQKFLSFDIPVLVKANLTLGDGTLSALVGPTFNFLFGNISTESTTKTSGLSNTTNTTNSELSFEDANWNTFVMGLEVGAEYTLKFGGGRLGVGCVVDFDLGDLDKDDNSSMKRFAITPQVTYYFGF